MIQMYLQKVDTGDDNTRLYRVWFRDSSWFSDELTMLYFWSISHLWLLVSEEYVHKQRHMWALKPSLEAFAFQYEMHASSYQINIATAQQVAKENGPPEDCTRDYHHQWPKLLPLLSHAKIGAWQCFRLLLQPDQWSALWLRFWIQIQWLNRERKRGKRQLSQACLGWLVIWFME